MGAISPHGHGGAVAHHTSPHQHTMDGAGMLNYFHFGISDVLLFQTWQPNDTVSFLFSVVMISSICLLKEYLYAYRRSLQSSLKRAGAIIPRAQPLEVSSPASESTNLNRYYN